MKIQCAYDELIDIDLLVPNPRNPNKHSERQIELLAKIMAHQGWRSPVVVSNQSGFIIKGHGRLMAAKLNKWTHVPVDRQDYATEADAYADMVADNKIAELAETDMAMVNADALELLPGDFDLDLLGIPDLNLNQVDLSDTFLEEKQSIDGEKKYVIEVQFPNDMEMMDIHDDLTARGYLVKVK